MLNASSAAKLVADACSEEVAATKWCGAQVTGDDATGDIAKIIASAGDVVRSRRMLLVAASRVLLVSKRNATVIFWFFGNWDSKSLTTTIIRLLRARRLSTRRRKGW